MPYLPPETISNYLDSGPGPASMRLVSQQWGLLCQEIMDLESKFNHMLACLTAKWSGPVGLQVIDAAKPFQRWLHDLSLKLAEAKADVRRIYLAYSTTSRNVVPSVQIATNHARRAWLANNPLGQNPHEIAQLDEQYKQFWVHNGQAWDWYRSELSAALSTMTPFPPPPPITHNTGSTTVVSESGYIQQSGVRVGPD